MTDTNTSAETVETAAKKSIVPSKYNNKYKAGGDTVSQFIKSQTEGSLESTFALCRKNGIPEDKVKHYEALFADKANNHGIEGRARMTLGNMLRSKARKEGKLLSLAGDAVEFTDLPKPVVSGAAAAAAAASGEATTEASDASAPEAQSEDAGEGEAPAEDSSDEDAATE